jgi:hypothetical protein
MQIRRTLEKSKYETGYFKPSTLKVGYMVSLTDADKNSDTLQVEKITDTEVVFEQPSVLREKYTVILTRHGDELRDEKGRTVEVWGQLIQYNFEGKEL